MKKQLIATERIFVTTLLITCLVCPGLYAAEEKLPAPEEIIAKNIEAMGGKDASKKIYNKKIVSIIKHVPSNEVEKVTQYQERPDYCYATREGGRGTRRYGSNGKVAWTIEPRSGARLFKGYELSARLFNAKIDQPEVSWKSLKTVSIEQIDGKDCYKVLQTPEKGQEMTVYYDKKSFMIVKLMFMQGNNKIERYNQEYKKVNNIFFVSKGVSLRNGQRIEEVTGREVELNIEMPEGIFDIPEEVKAIMDKKL